MSERVHVVARLFAKPGKEDELRRLLHALVAPTRVEAGCLRYELHEQRERSGAFVFVETWVSDAHLDAHLSSVHISETAAGLGSLVDRPPEILRYRAIA
ncbi:putative quinol monooxygenase [Vulgatibacter sp.]|uniref:putative quinol monooxygenase n=1 Tax=Vulgatibacter sp. TaxID=1971226 RepID=UPI003566DBC7